MVLLPCSACCAGCTCPTCVCCSCGPGGEDAWQLVFDQQTRTPGTGYAESYFKELYDDLVALLPGCISRLYESQTACVNALVAQALIDNPGMTEAEIRAAFEDYWKDNDCQNFISRVTSSTTWHGWSVPYINGEVATTAALAAQCPAGSPPSPLFCAPGQTAYWYQSEYTNTGTPDIRHLVLESPATGDWIADALLARGTQEDLPDDGWVEADDCASCDDPAVLEFNCDPATDNKVFYDKVVTVRESRPDPCGADELDLCPPENCKIVNIKVTRTNQCTSIASPTVTEWEVEIAVCPCAGAFVFATPNNANDDPIVLHAYGYASEQDCIDDLTETNCLGGTASSQCISNQWKKVRHSIDSGTRGCLNSDCVVGTCSGGPGCC